MPTYFILFGATGDLAQRKLYPALFDNFINQQLPDDLRILGVARSSRSQEEFRQLIENSLGHCEQKHLETFLNICTYVQVDYDNPHCMIQTIKSQGIPHSAQLVWYLAIPPQSFYQVITSIATVKDTLPELTHRLIIEKPFGQDLTSAQELNTYLSGIFQESEIYRIDHYLGKETVQNILALRFGNSMFEPLLNNRYVESIHIEVKEELGVEGRAAYFDNTGIIKDILQNHILQLMSLIMMEPPARMEAEFIRDEKYKVLRSLREIDCNQVIFGQYQENPDTDVLGYRQEQGVDPESQTETYVNLTTYVDNLRWEGVPVHITTGKRLEEKQAEIRIVFRPSFRYFMHPDEECNPEKNQLVIQIQPNEEVYSQVNAKFPGRGMCIQPVKLHFTYQSFNTPTKDAYTRLLRDGIEGDQTLFIRSDEIEAAWRYVTPLIDRHKRNESNLVFYPAGTAPQNLLEE